MTAQVYYPFAEKGPLVRRMQHSEIPGWHWDKKDEKYWVPYTFEHLHGNRPYKHPESILRDLEGRVIIEPGLVFMEKESRLLVVVKRAHPEEEYILYAPYMLSVQCSHLSYEEPFREQYMVWDDVGEPLLPVKIRECFKKTSLSLVT